MKNNESQSQRELFKLIAMRAKTSPKWNSIFAIPNGGLRDKTTAAIMKAEGAKAGVWDIHVPVPIVEYEDGHFPITITNAMFIEMKHGKNKLTEAQIAFRDTLNKVGSFEWNVCYSATEAYETICRYFGEEKK